MDIPATAQEQQELHARFTATAMSALDWTEGQMKVRGYIGTGWRIRAVYDEATTLFDYLLSHGPERVFADTQDGKISRTFISGLLHSLRAHQ